ncbi:MAG: hypothetical protein GX557_12855 [Chloroflexi bacterium]|nr:hypothetical protein [Chloroflexota bacterium]
MLKIIRHRLSVLLCGLAAVLALSACGRITAGVVETPQVGHGIEVGERPTATQPLPTETQRIAPAPTGAPAATAKPTLAVAASPTPAPIETPTSEDGEPVEAWEGVLVKLAPGSQFGQFFQRNDGERYGIGGADDATRASLAQALSSGALIRIWGRVYYGVPATEARHIEVTRVEALTAGATEARNLSPFAQATASSSLPSDRFGSYGAMSAIDGALETAWVEGAADAGVGESLRLVFPHEIVVERVALSAGYDASAELWAANNRVQRAMLIFSGGEQVPLELADVRGLQTFETGGIATTWVTLMIEAVQPGEGANDTCIAEFEVWGRTQ